MPVVIPILIKAVVTAVIVKAVDVVVDVIVEKVFGSDEIETRDASQSEAQAAARARALLVNKSSNNAGIPLVYGKYRMGGTRVYLETSNGNGDIADSDAGNEYFNLVLTLCEGEMGNIRELYFGDILVWSGNGNDSGSGYQLSGYAGGNEYSDADKTIRYHNGSANQGVDSMMQTSVGSSRWGSNHRLRGIAYLAVKLRANADAYAGGVPVITAVLEGKNIPNVSTITSGQTSTPTQTESADQNPADVIYDYLTNTTYGKGLDHDTSGNYVAGQDIDIASFKQARLDCASAWNGAGIVYNGPLSTEQRIFENIQRLTRACNGMLIWTGGKYRLIIQNANETSQYSFDEDNIIGQMSVQKAKKASRVNKVTAGFTDSSLNYVDNIVVTKDATALAEDNGTVLEVSSDHQLTTNSAFVTRLNQYRIDKTRNQMTISFSSTHASLVVECGNIISVSQEALNWTNKLFRVVTLEINEKDEVKFGAIEYVPSIQI
jgi:hypothetical protein